ncbi:MAG TPA: hypothetical protein VH414_19770 [Lichenihabitans sp.]|jgi:hypothetical protein|nr:hypothetical protein [Lichenihabitans sp.]
MTRSLRQTFLVATVLGGVGFAALPAEAMPVDNLAPANASELVGPVQQVRWHHHWGWHRGWHRHWGWHRGWHRHYGWRHRRW